MHRQTGNHIVVTGAGTGIGHAIALRLASEGAKLSLLGRNVEKLEETAALARSHGVSVHTYRCDIRDQKAVDHAFDRLAEQSGPIFALIANSGIGGANEPGPNDRFLDLVQTNLAGTYFCLRAAQRHLSAGPAPRHMVVVASILARFGVPGYTGYCASKAGLLGLVRALAMELAPQNVQVNALCPGWVDTEMAWQGIDGMAQGMGVTREEAYRIAMQAVPLGKMSQPQEIAGLVAWLLSADGGGVTGQGIDMNNGAWMG